MNKVNEKEQIYSDDNKYKLCSDIKIGKSEEQLL